MRMISVAIKRAKRPIILSLSLGPTPIEKANEVRKYAQMWRIANDFWDVWARQPLSSGLENEFDAAAKWAPYVQTGHWPDADMLPIGYLGPRPSIGKARETAFSHDEQRTLLTLWSMLRSPLFLGANVTANDPWTTSLLTNSDVIAVDQHSKGSRPVISTAIQSSGSLRHQHLQNDISPYSTEETLAEQYITPGETYIFPAPPMHVWTVESHEARTCEVARSDASATCLHSISFDSRGPRAQASQMRSYRASARAGHWHALDCFLKTGALWGGRHDRKRLIANSDFRVPFDSLQPIR